MGAPPALTCPRCGYDQSGIAASWGDSCPLTGLCSECGLAFDWVDIFRPDRERLMGFHEHARSRRERWHWAVVTAWWAMWPWVFWSRVTVFIPLRPRRSAAWLALSLLPLYIAGSALWGAMRAGRWLFAGDWDEAIGRGARAFIYPFAPEWFDNSWLPGWLQPLWRLGGAWTAHFWPTVIFSLSWPLLLLVLGDTLRAARVRRGHVVRAACYSMIWVVLLGLIRFADCLWGAAGATEEWGPGLRRAFPAHSRPCTWISGWTGAANIILFVWIAVWWYLALRLGLRLPRAELIWGVLMIPVLLILAIIAVISTAWAMPPWGDSLWWYVG